LNKPISSNTQTALDLKAIVTYYSTTIADTDWTGSGPYIATKTVTGIASTDRPIADLDLSAVSFADVEDKQADWALIYRVEASGTNEIKFYAINEPTQSLVVQLGVVK
jgi:hypothetical protein